MRVQDRTQHGRDGAADDEVGARCGRGEQPGAEDGTGGEGEEERLAGRRLLLVDHHPDGLGREVLSQVVALLCHARVIGHVDRHRKRLDTIGPQPGHRVFLTPRIAVTDPDTPTERTETGRDLESNSLIRSEHGGGSAANQHRLGTAPIPKRHCRRPDRVRNLSWWLLPHERAALLLCVWAGGLQASVARGPSPAEAARMIIRAASASSLYRGLSCSVVTAAVAVTMEPAASRPYLDR
ncbi:hypothetical protein ABH920_007306 [Catenulispora sp. EB89]